MRPHTNKMFVFFIALFLCSEVLANTLAEINNSVAFGMAILNLDFKKTFLPTDDLRLKSAQRGNVPGLTLNARTVFKERFYLDLYLDAYDGVLTYDGVYNQTPYVPLTIKARHYFFNSDAKVGYVFNFVKHQTVQIIPYLGVGYHFWDDFYELCLRTKYRNYKAFIGAKFNWLLTDAFVLSPYIHGGRTFDANMIRQNTGLKFDFGNNEFYEAGLELNYKLTKSLFLSGFVNYDHFRYDRADIIIDQEYASKTSELKYGLALRYSWVL